LQNPVHSVHTADEAIKYLGRAGHYVNRDLFPTPQVLVLDPNMPGKSGWEVLKWVREQREKLDLTALAVIILGGSGSPAEEDMAFRLGAMGYHVKPQTSEELEQVIKRICGSWQSPGKP
jgi:CheY-like chemotaxis protein